MEHIPQEILPTMEDMVARSISDMLLRIDQVRAVTGLSSATVYRQMQIGRFPRPVRITDRATAWRLTDIEKWMAERPES